MTTATQTRRTPRLETRGFVFAAIADWLVEKDRVYRDARRLERLTDEARKDMGLPPAERDLLPKITTAPW